MNERPILHRRRAGDKEFSITYVLEKDLDEIRRCFSDPRVFRTLAAPRRLRTKEAMKQWLEAIMSDRRNAVFGVFETHGEWDEESKRFAGLFTLTNVDTRARRGAIGYFVCPRYRHYGIATEGVRFVLKRAFKNLLLNVVYAEVKEPNAASLRVLFKNGFRIVERIPEYTVVPEYGRVALLRLAITRERRKRLHGERR